jgi:hypothetical protein
MIGPFLAKLLDHFSDTEFVFLADEFNPQSVAPPPMFLGTGRKSLKQSRLGHVRLAGTGKDLEANLDSEIRALLIFNALRGSGGSRPGFPGQVLHAARTVGTKFVLHHLKSGPVNMIDTDTGITVEAYRSLPEAISPYFSRLKASLFHVQQLDRALSRLKSARWMIGMAAEAAGEMMTMTDFTPVRFSSELEDRVRLLRSQRVEFGFVCARLVPGKPMIAALKNDAIAMGMEWHELNFAQHCPGKPGHGSPVGQPLLLVTMQNRRLDLMDRLNELAVQHRQDHLLRIYRDGAIELVAPYHNTVMESFTHLPAAVRALADRVIRNGLLPALEIH